MWKLREALHPELGHLVVDEGEGRRILALGVAEGEGLVEYPEHARCDQAAHGGADGLADEHRPRRGQGHVPRLEVLHEVGPRGDDVHHHAAGRQSRQGPTVGRPRPRPDCEDGQLAVGGGQGPVGEAGPERVAEGENGGEDVDDDDVVPPDAMAEAKKFVGGGCCL